MSKSQTNATLLSIQPLLVVFNAVKKHTHTHKKKIRSKTRKRGEKTMLMRKESTNWSKWMNKRASSFWNKQYQIAPPLNCMFDILLVSILKSQRERERILHPHSRTVPPCRCQWLMWQSALAWAQLKQNGKMWWIRSTRSFFFCRFVYICFKKGCTTALQTKTVSTTATANYFV